MVLFGLVGYRQVMSLDSAARAPNFNHISPEVHGSCPTVGFTQHAKSGQIGANSGCEAVSS